MPARDFVTPPDAPYGLAPRRMNAVSPCLVEADRLVVAGPLAIIGRRQQIPGLLAPC
jgi:hypothetical protein